MAPAREVYEILVESHLGPGWSEWFDGLAVTPVENGHTILAGPVADQAALHGLFGKDTRPEPEAGGGPQGVMPMPSRTSCASLHWMAFLNPGSTLSFLRQARP
jgi:hypothetical protein